MLRRVFLTLLTLFVLTGCASHNNTLDIHPGIALSAPDADMPALTINITSADNRRDRAVAKVHRDGQLVTLLPSRDLRFLLQEVLEKQMTSRGYRVAGAGVADVQIVLNTLFANVTQGNVRYSITTKADITLIATAQNGNKQIKNFRQTYSENGILMASNEKIAHAVNTVLSDVIKGMAQDTSIHHFIRQNAH